MNRTNLILILLLILLFSSNYKIEANSDSYYNLRMKIGENNTDIDEYINLDYSYYLNNYNLNLQLNMDKSYLFTNGRKISETNWDYDDYLISFAQGRNRLNIGETSVPATSSLLSGGDLNGIYLQYSNYKMWYGTVSNSSGFRIDSRKQMGLIVNLPKDQGRIAYLNSSYDETDNNYLTYDNTYSLEDFDYYLEFVLGEKRITNSIGEAVFLSLNSDWNKFNYNVNLNYQSSDFEKIKSELGYGHGKYDVSLRTYRQLGPYLLESNISYAEDNLDREGSLINKDWSSGVDINYYGNNDSIYRIGLIYDVNNDYEIERRINSFKEDDVGFKLSYQNMLWKYGLNLKYSNERNLIKNIRLNENSANIFVKYNPFSNYELVFNYDITHEKDDDLKRSYSLAFEYWRDLFNQVDYDVKLKLEKEYELKLDLKQTIGYNLSNKHELDVALNLIQYLEGGSLLEKELICEYKYNF